MIPISPQLRKEKLIEVDSDRIREAAKKRKRTMTSLADSVGTVYRNFTKQLAVGIIQKDWLEIICDELNVSRDYLTGKTEKTTSGRIPARYRDFNDIEKQKEGIRTLLTYSNRKELVDKVSSLSDSQLYLISLIISMEIEEPDTIADLLHGNNENED